MLDFPVPPLARITRQLTCVCCHESFTIAEDDAVRDRNPSDAWRLPLDRHPDTQLRYQPDRSRRSVAAEPRAKSNQSPDSYQEWDGGRYEQINCPRCGADNRNWMYIVNPPKYTLREQLKAWWKKSGTAVFGLLITAVLVGMAARFHFNPDPAQMGRSITLLIVIALAGIVPTMTMLGGWHKQREYKALRAVIPAKTSPDLSPIMQSWFAYTGLFLFILPLLLYFIIPGGFHLTYKLIKPTEPPPTPTLEQRINDVRGELEDILVQAPPGSTEMAEEAIADLIEFMADLPLPVDALSNLTLDQKADIVLTWAHDLARNSPEDARQPVIDAIADLERYVETADLTVTPPASAETGEAGAEGKQADNLPAWFTADRNFLSAWFRYVLAASIATLIFSLIAVNGYVRRISLHLPRPIFHSIANMTRVAVWEAGTSLEIEDEIHLIQWTQIQRNDAGGIDLEGIYRDMVPDDKADESLQARVRGQRYQISTDRWARIESAQITDVRVPVRPRLPKLPDRRAEAGISEEFFRTAVPVRKPQQPAEDAAA